MAFNALPQPIAPRGSGMITGVPTAVAAVSSFIDNINDTLTEAVTAATEQMTEEIRKAARRRKDWAPYADNLSVGWDDGDFVYYLSGTDEEISAMRALEYGREVGTAPQSVIRTTAVRMTTVAGQTVQEVLERELGLA